MVVGSERKRPIAPGKLRAVKEIKKLAKEYPTLFFCRMEKMPSADLQIMRRKLRAMDTVIKMAKNNLIKLALKDLGRKNIDDFLSTIEGSTALIFTKNRAFTIKKFLDNYKVNIPAKPGDFAPRDIIVNAGNTGFPPGAIISELTTLGLKTRVQSGMIWIKEDKVVVKKGDLIDRSVALVLSRLNIQPITITLNLYSGIDNEELISKGALSFDLDEIIEQLKLGGSNARTLAVEITWVTSDTVAPLLSKGQMLAKSLIANAPIILKEFAAEIIGAAKNSSIILATIILEKDSDALPEGLIVTGPPSSKDDDKDTKEDEKGDSTTGLGDLF